MEQQKQMLGGCLMPMMTTDGGAGGINCTNNCVAIIKVLKIHL